VQDAAGHLTFNVGFAATPDIAWALADDVRKAHGEREGPIGFGEHTADQFTVRSDVSAMLFQPLTPAHGFGNLVRPSSRA